MSQNRTDLEASITEAEASVSGETTLVDSVIALIDSLNAMLVEAVADTNSLPDLKARVQGIIDVNEANKARLAAAVPANVPNIPPEAVG